MESITVLMDRMKVQTTAPNVNARIISSNAETIAAFFLRLNAMTLMTVEISVMSSTAQPALPTAPVSNANQGFAFLYLINVIPNPIVLRETLVMSSIVPRLIVALRTL